jgi:hypothetical protein
MLRRGYVAHACMDAWNFAVNIDEFRRTHISNVNPSLTQRVRLTS